MRAPSEFVDAIAVLVAHSAHLRDFLSAYVVPGAFVRISVHVRFVPRSIYMPLEQIKGNFRPSGCRQRGRPSLPQLTSSHNLGVQLNSTRVELVTAVDVLV